jgi:PAS domain S-box-containing protein
MEDCDHDNKSGNSNADFLPMQKLEHLCRQILLSYQRTPHQKIIPLQTVGNAYPYLFGYSIPILAHSGIPSSNHSPRYTFVNKAAIDLFGYSWNEFIGLESRYSAQEDDRQKRDNMMQRASLEGYVMGYHGIRIRKTGELFHVHDAFIWNIKDGESVIGQAAILPRISVPDRMN